MPSKLIIFANMVGAANKPTKISTKLSVKKSKLALDFLFIIHNLYISKLLVKTIVEDIKIKVLAMIIRSVDPKS